jgi:hypothetical protein
MGRPLSTSAALLKKLELLHELLPTATGIGVTLLARADEVIE